MFGNDKDAEPQRNVDYTEYEEGIYVGYRWFDKQDIAVSYPFGYGLSYTDFEWSGASVQVGKKETVVSVDLKNEGACAGKDVVQQYVSAPSGDIDKPVKELRAFAKTGNLAPGESQRITLRISNSDLASYNEAKNAWIVDEGEYSFLLGASSRDIRATVTATVKGDVVKTNALSFNKYPLEANKNGRGGFQTIPPVLHCCPITSGS